MTSLDYDKFCMNIFKQGYAAGCSDGFTCGMLAFLLLLILCFIICTVIIFKRKGK